MEYTEVFAWGSDQFGQLGLGRKQTGRTYNSPRICSFSIVISKLSCGEEHTVFISKAGHLYSMGNNYEGRLGLGDKSILYSASPCLIESLLSYSMSDVSCGSSHTLASSSSGLCFSWGLGEFGVLGTGHSTSSWQPTKVKIPKKYGRVIQISAGSRHSAAITESASLLMWGSSESGQLGVSSKKRVLSPLKVTVDNLYKVALGTAHTLILCRDGSVYATGGNSFGQLGTGDKESRCKITQVKGLEGVHVKMIAAGNLSACVSANGEFYVWGTSSLGEFLTPNKVDLPNPVKSVSIGGSFAAIVDAFNGIYTWGDNSKGELGHADYKPRNGIELIQALDDRNVQSVSCGAYFCICLGETKGKPKGNQSRTNSEAKTQESTRNRKRHKSNELENTTYFYKTEVESLRKQLETDAHMHSQLRLDNEHLRQEISVLKDFTNLREVLDLKSEQSSVVHRRQNSLSPSFKKVNDELRRENSELYKEKSLLKEKIRDLERKIENIDAQNKTEMTSKYAELIDENRKIRNECDLKISEFQLVLDEQKVKYKQLESDYSICSAHNKRLEFSLEELETKHKHHKLDSDKENFENKSQVNNLTSQLDIQISENKRLQHELEKVSELLRDTQKKNTELNKLVKKVEDEKNSERMENKRLKIVVQDWEQKYNQVSADNQLLHSGIWELENKNKDLFDKVENELGLKAKEYKERTINMLNSSSKGRESPFNNLSSAIKDISGNCSPE